jgi:hypothetical protein
MGVDVPHAQQLSVWPEYNAVARRRLVWEAATALRCTAVGGTVILRLGDLFTMFTPSLLYPLALNFERFTIVKPFTSCAAAAECFAVLTGRLPDPPLSDEDRAIAAAQHAEVLHSTHDYLLKARR